MKKAVFCIVAAVAMIASVSALANSRHADSADHHHDCTTHVHMEGKRCRGTVGCDCPGFSPVTNGDVGEESNCKHCGHGRSYHR